MTVFRWIIGAFSALLVAGAGLSLLVFLLFDIPVWLDRARALRRGATSALLFWFNVEIWGRVVWTLTHW
jgi:hypothetical protein